MEFVFVLIPMLAFLFVLVDLAYAVYARNTLQYAVREGVRYGITGQTMGGASRVDSIKTVVQSNALGFLAGSSGLDLIHVRFYSGDNPALEVTGDGADAAGNLIEVSVEHFPLAPMMPILRSNDALMFTTRSSDRL